MRGRRGNSDPPVTLFAFQDVMTAIIGIILLIVLLLALQSSMVADAVGTLSPESDSAARTEARLAELKRRESAARAKLAAAGAKTVVESTPEIVRVNSKRAELASLYRKIESAEREIAREYSKLQEVAVDGSPASSTIERVVAAQQQVDRLKGELDLATLSRRLTYIAMQGYGKKPVLLEIASSAWRVAGDPASMTAITFGHPSALDRLKALEAFMADLPPAEHYVLLVIKPSGLEQVEAVAKQLHAGRYELGVDLIPEDWTSLFQGEGANP